MFSPKTNYQYPILLCPDRWYQAIQRPQQIEFMLAKPQKIKEPIVPFQVFTIFLIGLNISMIIAGIFLQKKYDWLLPVGIGFSILCFPMVWRDYSDFQKQRGRLVKLKERYVREMKSYQSEYKKFQQMQKQLGELSPTELLRQVSLQILQNTTLPGEEPNPKIGISEPFFQKFLTKYFSNNVYVDRILANENSDRPYYPDFVFSLPELRLYIDIEIDEPYTPLSGNSKPKHYQKKDDDRDQFFLNKGWFVIRFSEQQIVEQPDSCCKVIAQCVNEIILDDRFLEKFLDVPDIKIQPQWTDQEAQKMIIHRTRINYLPKDLLKSNPSKKTEIETRSEKSFSPSSYQTDIFDFITNQTGNGIVIAVAGSGKSTTLIEAAKLLTTRSALFVAFNRSIAEELRKKLNNLMESKTIHSLGLNILKNHLKDFQTNDKKYRTIVNQISPHLKLEEKLLLEQLINYCRYTLTNPTDREAMELVAEHYNLDLTFFNQAFPYLVECLDKGKEVAKTDKVLDFTDMIWLPNVWNLSVACYDWMFVDECQDLSTCQLELILKCLSDRGRILFVGDPFQSIYGFSGADCDSVEKIKHRVNATELPLSICYRCPSSHIALAKEIVPQIEPRENAPEGIIAKIDRMEFYELLQDIDDRKTLVIGRRTAPLINIYMSLNQAGIPTVLKGGEIKQELIDIVNKVKGLPEFNFNFFIRYLRIYHQQRREQIKLNRHSKQQLEFLSDQIASIESVFNRGDSQNIAELINEIEDSFTDNSTSVTLCTVHKAKGLESDRVFIIAPNEIPLVREGQKEWEKEQELHLKYVALTRSKSELYFVNLD